LWRQPTTVGTRRTTWWSRRAASSGLGSQASRMTLIRASCTCTPATTEGRPNCGRVWSSSLVRPTRVLISLSNCRSRTRPGCRAGTRAASRSAPELCGTGLVTPPFWFAASHLLTMRTPMGRKLRSTLLSHGHPLARGQTEGPGCRRCRAGAENNRSAEWHAGARGRPPRGRVERDLVHRVPARLGWIALPVLGEDGQRYTNVEL